MRSILGEVIHLKRENEPRICHSRTSLSFCARKRRWVDLNARFRRNDKTCVAQTRTETPNRYFRKWNLSNTDKVDGIPILVYFLLVTRGFHFIKIVRTWWFLGTNKRAWATRLARFLGVWPARRNMCNF